MAISPGSNEIQVGINGDAGKNGKTKWRRSSVVERVAGPAFALVIRPSITSNSASSGRPLLAL